MEITKELLKQKFMEYNELYFNNELKMCRFTYTYMRDVFDRYMTHTTPKGEKVGHIWISKSIDLDEEMLSVFSILPSNQVILLFNSANDDIINISFH